MSGKPQKKLGFKKTMQALRNIKVLALDCDGVMAPLHIDTGVIMPLEEAQKYHDRKYSFVVEIARFHHRDGQGIDLIKEAGIHVVVVTKQRSGYVDARCFKLGVPCVKTMDKLAGLKKWLAVEHPEINMSDVCYMGDDVSDLPVLKTVGIPITVADAVKQAKETAIYVTKRHGGDCAVREVCDLILKAKNKGGTCAKQ